MGQDPGDEILAAKGVFHFEQASQGLFFVWSSYFLLLLKNAGCIHMYVFCDIQDPTRSRFCTHDQEIEQAYVELLDSSKQTLGSMLQLQEVWLPAFISASMLRYSSPYCTFPSFLTLYAICKTPCRLYWRGTRLQRVRMVLLLSCPSHSERWLKRLLILP
jgi:hypothetical protein